MKRILKTLDELRDACLANANDEVILNLEVRLMLLIKAQREKIVNLFHDCKITADKTNKMFKELETCEYLIASLIPNFDYNACIQ